MTYTIRQLLKLKGNSVWHVKPETTVYHALEIMAEKDIGALVVLDDQGNLVGIFSERDYARKVVLKGKSSKETTVQDMMSMSVFYVSPDTQLEECMALMTTKHVRHLPVLEDGQLIGIVSIGDVVKKIISEHKFTINELEKYITGNALST